MLTHSIRRIDAIAFSPGKNCSDHVMVADAVELALTAGLSTMVLVTSDADFTDLAMRLREYGLHVCGYGERKCPAPFVHACERFTFLDELAPPAARHPVTTTPLTGVRLRVQAAEPPTSKADLPEDLSEQLCAIVARAAGADGWANLSTVCARLHAHRDLKAKLNGNLGSKPGLFLKQCGLFDVIDRPGRGIPVTYLRNKPRPKRLRS